MTSKRSRNTAITPVISISFWVLLVESIVHCLGNLMIKLRSFFYLISVSQQEILSLYNRFCQLDRNSGGFVSADEFMSVPEFAVNPLAQVGKLVL